MSLLKFLTPQQRLQKFPGIRRLFFHSDAVQSNEPYERGATDMARIVPEEQANLIGSMTDIAGMHLPVLDIDVPARLIPSSTPGHSHLLIDVPLDWEEYKRLLYALRDAGILERGYVDASVNKGATFVRKPGVKKPFFPDSFANSSSRDLTLEGRLV